MSSANLKKTTTRIVLIIIGAFILYSIYIHIEYRNMLSQIQDRNYDLLSSISYSGNNLADRLEVFFHLPIDQEENDEVRSELFNNWRIVNGESKQIHSNLTSIWPHHMGNEASDWSLLVYSLNRVDGFLHQMTNKYLESRSYVRSNEENDKLVAVITIYRALRTYMADYHPHMIASVDIRHILKFIEEPMLIIDSYYPDVLEQSR